MLTLKLFPDTEASDKEIAHDSEYILTRLKNIGIKDAFVDTESGTVTAHTHTSVFGQIENLSDAIRLTINRPGNLNVIGTKGIMYEYNLIERDLIRLAEARFGSLPQIGIADRLQAGLSPTEDYPYLYLVLDERAQDMIDDVLEYGDTLSFGFDVDTLLERGLQIALVLPGQEAGSYYLLDGRWKSLSVWNALAYNLMHDPLCSSYTFTTDLDPAANWQDPAALSADARGKNQQPVDSLTGDTVTLFYRNPSPEEISDFNYDLTHLAFKQKLDTLGLPYAIGTDYFDQRRIAVCMPTENLCYDIVANILPATHIRLSSAYYHDDTYFPWQYHATVRQGEEGWYTLVLSATDSGDQDTILASTEKMLADGDSVIDLTCVSSIKIAEMKIETPVDDGILIFDSLPFLGVKHISEEYRPILDLLCEIINTDSGVNGSYYTLDTYSFSSSDGSFGISRNIAEGADLIENISQDYPPAEARRNPTGGDMIYIFMHEEISPGFADSVAERIESIYQTYDIENSNVDAYLFILTDENDQGLCRIEISKTLSGRSEPRYTLTAIIQGQKFAQYRDEIEQAFSSREFFDEHIFDVWELQ